MAFDSKDTAAFKGVWVFCEQREGVIMSTSYQLLSEGRKLANDLGVELCGAGSWPTTWAWSCAAWCWARTSRRTT